MALLNVCADGVEAVLQLPRGNLEAVRPRALVLPAVAAALDAGDYAGGQAVGGLLGFMRGVQAVGWVGCPYLAGLQASVRCTPSAPRLAVAQRLASPTALSSTCTSLPFFPAGAWQLATVNRLDLNVLVDFRWPRFLGQAALLVEQVGGWIA